MNEILQKRITEAAKTSITETLMSTPNYEFSPKATDMLECAYIKGAEDILNNQWISVEEDLPLYDKAVIGMDYMPELAWDDQTIIFVHRSDNPNVVTDKNKFCVYPPSFCKVTHWMEIPSL